MKNNSVKVIWSLLGLWTFLLIIPTFVAAEDNDSNMPLSIDIELLSASSENAEVLDVEVSDLLGIDKVDVKIPSSAENTEKLAGASIIDEEMGHIEANVLSNTETSESNEQAVADIEIEEFLGTDEVDVEVLKHEENCWNDTYSNESSVADIAAEELLGTDGVDIEVLKHEENHWNGSYSDESSVADISAEELLVTDKVDVEVLKHKENDWNDFRSDESSLADISAEELLGTEEVDVEVLKHKENDWNDFHSDESSVADISAEELLVTDEVDVEVLKHKENHWNGSYSEESSVADIAAEELLGTEEVDIEVLAHKEDSLTNYSTHNEAVVQAIIDDLITTDQIELNVLKSEESIQNQIQMEEQQAVHFEIKDLPLLETLHVGVLESKSTEDSTLLENASAFLTVGLGDDSSSTTNSLLDEVELNVLQNSQSSSDNFIAEKSALVGLELADTNLGELSTYVLLSESAHMDDNTSSNSGLVEVISDDLILLEDVHLGVLDRHLKDDGEVSTLSEGVLQLNIISDLTDELDVDILTNDEITANGETHRNGKTISIGLINDLVGGTNVDVLPTERYVFAALDNPMPSTEVVEEGLEVNEEKSANENNYTNSTPVANEDEEYSEEQNPPSTDEEIIVLDGGDSGSKDTMIENPTLTDVDESLTESEDESGIAANFNNMDGTSFTGNSLPQTGGFFTGVMLLMLALSLLGSGWTIRKLA